MFNIYKSQDMEATLRVLQQMNKKTRCIHTVEYSAIKKNEIMPFATTWMDLESVILSEVSQTEKEKYRMTSVTCGI